MGFIGIIFLAFLAVAYFVYAGLNKNRKEVVAPLNRIEALLRERQSITATIISLTKKTITNKDLLFEEIGKIRTIVLKPIDKSKPSEVATFLHAEVFLQSRVEDLIVAAGKNQDLKSDARMRQAQKLYFEFEQPLAEARKKYNMAVENLNKKVRLFPSSIIANMLDIKVMPIFKDDSDAPQMTAAEYLEKIKPKK